LLTLLSSFKPFNTLTKKEMDIYALLLTLNEEKKYIEYDDRMKIIFDYSTKRVLMDKLQISQYSFHNKLKSLRDKGFVVHDKIEERLLLPKDIYSELTIRFTESE
jgi:hypothetical protein